MIHFTAKVLVGRVHNFLKGKWSTYNHKIKYVTHFLLKKALFLTAKGPFTRQFFIRTGAMHPLLKLDRCKCTRCTRIAAAPDI